MLAYKVAFFREGQNKVQEQSRLQQPGHHVAPVDNPVKIVQLAGELEGVEDERDQAENVEMGGTRGRPSAQQHIEPNAQIDQSDETKPEVERAFGRDQDHGHVQRNRMPNQRVSCFRPGAHPVHLSHAGGSVRHLALVDRGQAIARPNASLVARAIWLNPVGYQAAIASHLFHPPHTVPGNLEIEFLLEVDPGQNHGGSGQQDEQASGKADLKLPVHRPQRLLMEGRGVTQWRVLHVRGQGGVQSENL